MQQFLHWRVQVLLLCGGHQKVIDVVGDWYEASIEQQVLGARIESSQRHNTPREGAPILLSFCSFVEIL